MTVEGSLLLGYQPVKCKNYVNFFRMVITAIPPRNTEDMDFVLNEIERLGDDITIYNLENDN